ncbi:MAG: tRNA pseudouridine(38-40) synthase TruA [Bacillota bacterium]|nr:tRNA pseudouridine(38-40) synthase TruA [Bacillota bacterium]
MQRYKCIISYDGTGFSGFQIQPNKRTVQGVLEEVLGKIHKGKRIKVIGSGRTDAGVHAKGQVIHFDSSLSIPVSRWAIALNSLLPNDVSILSVVKIDQKFHARFDTAGKEYRYYLHLSNERNPFLRHFAFSCPYSLNFAAIKEASEYLLGTHDFTSFCSAKSEVEDKVRTIKEIDFIIENDLIIFRFVGNGFLYNMVRILVGTLLEVGTGNREPKDVIKILEGRDRRMAGKTAPAHGLYLWQVFYK